MWAAVPVIDVCMVTWLTRALPPSFSPFLPVHPSKKIDTGTFRLDTEGRRITNKVNYARSETHLIEVCVSGGVASDHTHPPLHHTHMRPPCGVLALAPQVLEDVCQEMKNYSNFEEHGRTVYRRYQKRPGQTGPLNLTNFGWSGAFCCLRACCLPHGATDTHTLLCMKHPAFSPFACLSPTLVFTLFFFFLWLPSRCARPAAPGLRRGSGRD